MPLMHFFFEKTKNLLAGVSRAGARTRLQLWGYGDIQDFDSSSPATAISHNVTMVVAVAGEIIVM